MWGMRKTSLSWSCGGAVFYLSSNPVGLQTISDIRQNREHFERKVTHFAAASSRPVKKTGLLCKICSLLLRFFLFFVNLWEKLHLRICILGVFLYETGILLDLQQPEYEVLVFLVVIVPVKSTETLPDSKEKQLCGADYSIYSCFFDGLNQYAAARDNQEPSDWIKRLLFACHSNQKIRKPAARLPGPHPTKQSP